MIVIVIGLKQKKILKVFSTHIGNQEVEINQLMSSVADYRKKIGDLGISDSIVNQRADFERQLQEVRQENQGIQLQLSSKEKDLAEQENIFKEMDKALQNLTSQNVTKELSGLQNEVQELEKINETLDGQLRQIEEEINNLLNTKAKVT
jgi:predicted  nucleic acid-binding Zn-ribbon protein